MFNSLVSSLIQYVVANRVTPPRFFSEVRKLATSFIWAGKKAKVAYWTLTLPISEGGLRVMDLESRVKVNLLNWVKKALIDRNSTSAEFIKSMLGGEDLALLLGSKRPLPPLIPPISPFYAQVLELWARVNDFPPNNEETVRGEVLWDNHRISSPKNMLSASLWGRWTAAGITLVNHICHPVENRVLGQQEIKAKFGIKCNFLEALTVRSSIPFSWRSLLSQDFQGEISQRFEFQLNSQRFDVINSSPKKWYEEMTKEAAHPFNRAAGWDRDLNLGESEVGLDWNSIFTIPYKTTRETKLKSFAYKLIYRLTPCNKYLHTIGIKTSSKCSLCPEVDNTPHFFYRCARIRPFWDALHAWCSRYLDCSLSHLSEIEIILGLTNREPQQKMINWLLLCAKFYIQKAKLFHGAEISLMEFLAELRLKLSVERRACFWEQKPGKFRCWNKLYSALG